MMDRRSFLSLTAAAANAGTQTQPIDVPKWLSPVIDIHLHWRQDLRLDADANIAHMDGCGATRAILLTNVQAKESARAKVAKYPQRLIWSVSADITKPDAEKVFTAAVRDGAKAFGEIKFHVAADGPELRRMYSLAADLNVPILIHFQEAEQFAGEGVYSTGFKQFAKVLKAFPKTRFVGHADAFWANISADYNNETAYPSGPIQPGGVTDKLLGDFPNLYADMSANSGNNALSRDLEFTKAFLVRHQNKLMFGSDCPCTDGRGGGTENTKRRLAGKCVARETLTLLGKHASPEVFRKLAWENALKLYKISG